MRSSPSPSSIVLRRRLRGSGRVWQGVRVAPAHTELLVTGYLRVSRVGLRRGPRFISPAVQREGIEAWATSRGAQLLDVFCELDQSGARADRPLLEQAIEQIELGASQGLVVWRVDRFSRSLSDGLNIIRRVTSTGGEFYSVHDGFDTSTESGRLMLRILLSLGETDIERARTNFEIAHLKALERGTFQGAYVAVGYRRTRTGRLRPHPRTGPIVTELYNRRAEGHSVQQLCRWLEQHDVPSPKGNPRWVNTTLAYLLGRRVYLGELSWRGNVNEHAHPALTDPATWEAAQRPRQRTYDWTRSPSLLCGLVRCASCCMTMGANRPKGRPGGRSTAYYLCRGESASGPCPSPARMTAQYLEPYVETAVLELLRRRRRAPQAALQAAERALNRAERDLAAYRDSPRLLHILGEADFAAGLHVRADRARHARAHFAAERARHRVHGLPPIDVLELRWPTMTTEARREIVAAALDCVFVKPGRLAIEERVIICPRGTGPARLPRPGDRGTGARPYTPPKRLNTATAHRSAYLWSRTRIQRELRAFLRDHDRWPSRQAFHDAGHTRLYLNIVLGDGEHYWALRCKRPLDDQHAHAPWTEQRIHDTLALYLADKPRWPTYAEFSRDGMRSLRQAIITTGGVANWQPRFPDIAPVQRRPRLRGWDDDRVRAELAHALQGRDIFPTRQDFIARHHEQLYGALIRHGGVTRWATEFELPTARERPRKLTSNA
jgi:DNA invertase Pin-like site-specific DNA recombinase